MNTAIDEVQYSHVEAQILFEAVGDLTRQRDEATLRAERAERAISDMSLYADTQPIHHREADCLRLGDPVNIVRVGDDERDRGHVFAFPDCVDTHEPMILVKCTGGALWVCKPEDVTIRIVQK